MLLINDLKSNNSTNKLFNYNYMLIINYVKSNNTCTFTTLKKLSTLTQLFILYSISIYLNNHDL